eukprot:scaffold701_cov158-Amphora_coffeaeformis.AAC.5
MLSRYLGNVLITWVITLNSVVSFVPRCRTLKSPICHANRNEAVVTVSSPTSSSHDEGSSKADLWGELLSRFQGDFDNYNQVVQDRKEGLLPREGGGHEHIHCSLVPVSKDSRLAAFYFDGDPGAIFRFRFYKLVPEVEKNSVDTRLFTLDPDLEGIIRQCPNPLEWKRIFDEQNGNDRVTELKDCDVRWSWVLDPVQHAYAATQNKDKEPGIHAVMVHGEALVESQMMPGVQILIRDQLSLWKEEFWIHDRGFEPSTMKFIYGNQREIPYRLERVAHITMASSTETTRQVVNDNLSWTLGPEHRNEEEYEQKLAKVGGPSRPKRR